jgi:hypothetical protein
MHIHTPTNTYPYSVSQLKRDNPQTSFPKDMNDTVLASWGVYPVQPTPQPQFDPITQGLNELPPIEVDGEWLQQWDVQALSAEEVAANQAAAQVALVQQYEGALTRHLDATAQAKRYDNRITCAVRAGYPGPFQAEGQAFAAWMDNCNALAYQWWAEIAAGTKPMFASTDAFIDDLPAMVWPS